MDHEYAQELVLMLRRVRLRMSTEAAMQADLQDYFDEQGLEYAREKPLGPKDRPDFLSRGVAIEVKKRCGKKDIWLQMQRYAWHDSVQALILVTGTAVGMPEYINGKPVYVVSAGHAFL